MRFSEAYRRVSPRQCGARPTAPTLTHVRTTATDTGADHGQRSHRSFAGAGQRHRWHHGHLARGRRCRAIDHQGRRHRRPRLVELRRSGGAGSRRAPRRRDSRRNWPPHRLCRSASNEACLPCRARCTRCTSSSPSHRCSSVWIRSRSSARVGTVSPSRPSCPRRSRAIAPAATPHRKTVTPSRVF